jgi:hypothetical protein
MPGGGKVLPASTEAGERRREVMRFLISARVPTEKTNALIREGRFPQILQSIMEDLQPEAAYFTDVDGARGGYFVVNGDDSSEMFSKTEALFQGMGAEIRIHLVWTAEDVQKGMPALEQAAQKYGDSE